MLLVLRTTVINDTIKDDYIVHDREPGINVGRIKLTGFPGSEQRWNWYLQVPDPFEAGTTATLEAANAESRRRGCAASRRCPRRSCWRSRIGRKPRVGGGSSVIR
jgi:hypothetical protein